MEAIEHHRRARRCIEQPHQQRDVVELLARAALRCVQIDLRKLAVEPGANRAPRTVERRVGHLEVERLASRLHGAHVAIEQSGGQQRIEAAEVVILDGGVCAKAEDGGGGIVHTARRGRWRGHCLQAASAIITGASAHINQCKRDMMRSDSAREKRRMPRR